MTYFLRNIANTKYFAFTVAGTKASLECIEYDGVQRREWVAEPWATYRTLELARDAFGALLAEGYLNVNAAEVPSY